MRARLEEEGGRKRGSEAGLNCHKRHFWNARVSRPLPLLLTYSLKMTCLTLIFPSQFVLETHVPLLLFAVGIRFDHIK